MRRTAIAIILRIFIPPPLSSKGYHCAKYRNNNHDVQYRAGVSFDGVIKVTLQKYGRIAGY
jgi:hypothetical protein